VSSGQPPSQDFLEYDLVRVLLEPPDGAVARELTRDIGRSLKAPVSRLVIADALRRLAPHQRHSGARDRAFLRSAVLSRVQREAQWIAQPIDEPLPDEQSLGEGDLLNGTWSWASRGLSTLSTPESRWAVLHLSLVNGRDEVAVGQPIAIVIADGARAFNWSPLASASVPADSCPDGCRGSLASVAVEPHEEIVGHLSFPLPTGIEPTHWGLVDDDSVELRPFAALADVATPAKS